MMRGKCPPNEGMQGLMYTYVLAVVVAPTKFKHEITNFAAGNLQNHILSC